MAARNIYSVGQVNSYIKNMFAQDTMLGLVYVRGEISNLKKHSSGHIYFTLKDEKSAISCVMFAGSRKGLAFELQEGIGVVVKGKIEVYERDGKYQLYASEIKREGSGDLNERFEALKRRLSEMGMFSGEYKQPVPYYVKTLGVVTSPTGAAVRDIINVSKRRNPYVQIILYPAIVQGDQAAASIVKGIQALEAYGVDAMIVGRGGGSIEDLWAFNEEAVAQAIFDCLVPVISAVGHETDFTIADFVADLRAPTPSAAAELAVRDMHEVMQRMDHDLRRLETQFSYHMENSRAVLREFELRMKALSPESSLNEKRTRVMHLEQRLQEGMGNRVKSGKHRLELCAARLKGCSPLEKLSAGYGHVETADGRAVTDIGQVKAGDALDIYIKNGKIMTRVLETRAGEI